MNKHWEELSISLGSVQENTKHDVVFKGTENLPEIKNIEVGCASCTTYTFDEENKKLTVTLVLGAIPVHLRMAQKDQPFNKSIKVKYFDGSMDVLLIVGSKTIDK